MATTNPTRQRPGRRPTEDEVKQDRPQSSKETTKAASPSEATEAGSALMDEARLLLIDRQWKSALPVLRSAQRLRPTDGEIDEMLVVATSHAKQRTERDEAIQRLSNDRHLPSRWNALAAAKLATHDFEDADRFARQALDLDPESITAWNTLAASYAGLGWFDEARECLDKTEKLDGQPEALERWQIGRAVNKWAMTDSYTLILAIVLTLLLGLLGVAFVITAPLVLREIRVAKLDEELREMADETWAGEYRMRAKRGVAVLLVLVAWLALLQFTPVG